MTEQENKTPTITRRNALRLVGLAGISVALAACDNPIQSMVKDAYDQGVRDARDAGATKPVTLNQQDIGQKGPEPTPTSGPSLAASPAAQANGPYCQSTEAIAFGKEIVPKLIAVNGIPDKVDGNTVLMADGNNFKFQNPLWRMMYAEPGGLWAEPGTLQAERQRSGGNIQIFNPLNQEVLGTQEYCWNLPQGGFNIFTADKLSLNIERTGVRVDLEQIDPRHIHYLAIRGFFPDPVNFEDRNRQVDLYNYKAGFVQARRLNSLPGNKNVAYLSEGQLFQEIDVSVGGKTGSETNCGSADCTTMTLTLLDINTKAIAVIRNITATNQNGELAYSNFG